MNRGISVLSAAAMALMLSNGAWAADEHPVDAAGSPGQHGGGP